MAQDIGSVHGLPIMATFKSPGKCSPTDNGYPKQPQQHYFPCTTQASPRTMTDEQAGPLNGSRPSYSESPPKFETVVAAENTTRASKSSSTKPDTFQRGHSAASQQELMLEAQVREQDHYSDDLQHRIKDMWPSQPNYLGDFEARNGHFQKRASKTEPRCRFFQPAHGSQNINDYEKLGSLSRDWMADSHILFQQPLSWSGLLPSTKLALGQSIYYRDRLDLVDQGLVINTSTSSDPDMGNPVPSSNQDQSDYTNVDPTAASFHDYTASADNALVTTLSPNTNLSVYEAPPAMHQNREDNVQFSDGDIDPEYKDDVWWQDPLLGDSPSSMEATGSKVDEPYAQLIYRAFLSRPTKSMTLQEIYQWFRENTDKWKSEGKGWQNSIRHNLSMNGAFTKRNSKTPLSGNGDGSVSLDNAGVDGRKSTEWFLEPAFYAGVESTTRYRKGNSGSRSRGAGNNSGRSRLGSDGHGSGGGGFSHARVSAGRKGGNVAAQNRKRLAERQQHARQVDIIRANPRHLQHQGYQGSAGVPYSGFDEAAYYPHYTTPQLAPSPFAPGFGRVPATIVQGQGPSQTDIVYHGFKLDDVGGDADADRSQTLGTDIERNEPLTPPGSNLDPLQSMEYGNKHREFVPELTSFHNPLNSYQTSVDFGQHQHLHEGYTSASVMGIWEAPAGVPQPRLFVDEDVDSSPEDALLMNLNFGE